MIAAGLLLFAALAWMKKEWGIYLIIFLLPTYQIRFAVGPVPLTFLESLILILAAVELIGAVSSAERRSQAVAWAKGLLSRLTTPRSEIFYIFLFLLAATVSIFISPFPVKAAGIWKAFFIEPVIFYFMILGIIDTPEKLKKLFLAISGLVAYLSIFGLYQFLTLYALPESWWAVDVASRRIISLVNHPNALALLLGPVLALLIFLPKKTKLHWVSIVLGSAALYLSFSRAAWLALIITVAGFAIIHNPLSLPLILRGRKQAGTPPLSAQGGSASGGKLRGGRGALLLLLIVIIVMIIPFSRQKLLELTHRGDASRENRVVLWTAAADMLKKSPVLGVGLTGFREAYKNYPLGPDRVVQNYPHNFFLNFWLETGLLGIIAMLGLLVLFYKKVIPPLSAQDGSASGGKVRGGKGELFAFPAAAAMTVIILHGLVDVPYFKNDLAVLFWTILALPYLSFRA